MNKLKIIFPIIFILAFCNTSSAANYKIDDSHTQIMFKVKHLGISTVTGLFGKFEGSFEFDESNMQSLKTNAKINTTSVDTNNEKRDKHLRSPDFFNSDKFPEISFVSKEIKNIEGNSFTMIGDLTIHGVTKSVELDTEFSGAAKDPWGAERAAFSASTEINRKDFGLTWSKVLETGGLVVDDKVRIQIEVEGIKQ